VGLKIEDLKLKPENFISAQKPKKVANPKR
jgi:hypothetical protein